MDVQRALKSQYHAALAMLRQTVENCPDALWADPEDPRAFWRVAYHAIFFAHLYLMPEEAAFRPWQKHRVEVIDADGPVQPYAREELLEYWRHCDGLIDSGVDALDLSAPECGFHWYTMPKLDHQILNIRHIQEHSGQLAERLNAIGVDTKWVGAR